MGDTPHLLHGITEIVEDGDVTEFIGFVEHVSQPCQCQFSLTGTHDLHLAGEMDWNVGIIQCLQDGTAVVIGPAQDSDIRWLQLLRGLVLGFNLVTIDEIVLNDRDHCFGLLVLRLGADESNMGVLWQQLLATIDHELPPETFHDLRILAGPLLRSIIHTRTKEQEIGVDVIILGALQEQ